MQYKITNKNNYELEILSFGAVIQSLKVPVSDSNKIDVVLGFKDIQNYKDSFALPQPPYFGAIVGRYSGRIKNAQFILNNQTIFLDKNHFNHHLHGGKTGFSQVEWSLKSKTEQSITLEYISQDLDDKYPGKIHTTIRYSLSNQNELIVDIKAKTNKDTILNLTHHGYFNLDGHSENILKQDLKVNSNKILELDHENIPTGNFTILNQHELNYTTLKKCRNFIDNTFVLDDHKNVAVSLISTKNNLKLDIYTNQPAVHIYVGGNCFEKIKGKENAEYHSQSGICFETQNFPDAPNHNNFPNSILKKGILYQNKTIFQFKNTSI